MLRKALTLATVAMMSLGFSATAATANPIKDCDTGFCACDDIAVGYPGKDPILVIPNDC